MNALLALNAVRVALAGRVVLDAISLAVSRGEVVALLGPNGAGKTTLLRAALGVAKAEVGAVRLGESDPMLLSVRDRALRAAYLPQRPQAIWPVSVERLVALGRYCYGASPDRLGPQDQAAVDEAITACGLTILRKRRMDEISGGEKMRAHLARALAQRAPLLILDEPTAGLDPAQALAAGDIMRAHAAAGGGVLFSTHDLSLAARCADRVVLLHSGVQLSTGAPEAALTPELLHQAYGREGRLTRVEGALVATFT